MRKKLFGAFLIAVLAVSQVMGVCAAGSSSGSSSSSSGSSHHSSSSSSSGTVVVVSAAAGDSNTVVTAVPAYTAADLGLTDEAKASEVRTVTMQYSVSGLNAAATSLTDPDNVMAQVSAMVSQFCNVHSYEQDPTTGKWNICVAKTMPDGATTANTRILYFDTTSGKWRLAVPATVTSGGLTAAVNSSGPMAIVMISGGATSPQTGEASGWTLWMLAAAALAGASILASKKKRA